MTYTLIRTTPRGNEHRSEGLTSRRKVATAAAFTVHDNSGGLTRAEFNALAAQVHDAALGETVTHEPSGYRFRTEEDS